MNTRYVAENAAALSGVFHQSRQYKKFYEKYGAELSGFPGIWKLCADAAVILGKAEHKHKRLTGKECEWIDLIDAMVDNMISHAYSNVYGAKAPTSKDLAKYASHAVQKASQ